MKTVPIERIKKEERRKRRERLEKVMAPLTHQPLANIDLHYLKVSDKKEKNRIINSHFGG